TFAQRVAAWCHWFDLPAPELPQSDGGLVLGDDLPNWKKFTPCSLDCIEASATGSFAKTGCDGC
ncbi:MAG: hypothetical protein AB8B71_15155, partial [Paracoccaceae bacterium]